MKHHAETAVIPAMRQPTARSAAAKRMRAHRERRKSGLRCLTIQLFETEVDVLIQRGLLKADARSDKHAVCQALYAHLDRTLGEASSRATGDATVS
jgi:hypothetical protein